VGFDPRRTNPQDQAIRICWAGIQELDVAGKYVVLRELATELALDDVRWTNTPKARVRHAVLSLHQAAETLGHSPTQSEYRELRESFPELDLMPDGSVRRS
jgi:hypothetical protein